MKQTPKEKAIAILNENVTIVGLCDSSICKKAIDVALEEQTKEIREWLCDLFIKLNIRDIKYLKKFDKKFNIK